MKISFVLLYLKLDRQILATIIFVIFISCYSGFICYKNISFVEKCAVLLSIVYPLWCYFLQTFKRKQILCAMWMYQCNKYGNHVFMDVSSFYRRPKTKMRLESTFYIFFIQNIKHCLHITLQHVEIIFSCSATPVIFQVKNPKCIPQNFFSMFYFMFLCLVYSSVSTINISP